jgi:endonuclease/exonuclease/phosphatase family metal-dependent hydrolase
VPLPRRLYESSGNPPNIMATKARSLSVLTLNVWNREGPWPKRLPLIKSWISRLQPDLIGLQEVVDATHIRELLSDCDFHSEWLGTNSGIAIAARWPIHDREELWLPGDDEATGGPALRGRVQSPYGVIPFTCATTWFYMTHHGFKRERQMPALNEFARERDKSDFPAILVGDFNTDPESAEIRYLKGLQSLQGGSAYWHDAWEQAGDGSKGTTWSKGNDFAAWAPWPNRRIDYIFVAQPRLDGPGAIEHCSVVCNESLDGVWPSDHFGVFARVDARKHR